LQSRTQIAHAPNSHALDQTTVGGNLGNVVRNGVTVGGSIVLADELQRRGQARFSAGIPVDPFVPPGQFSVFPG
jgi:hypothetical protein